MTTEIDGEATEVTEVEDDEEGGEPGGRKKKKSKKALAAEARQRSMLIIGSAALFVIGSLAAVYLSGLLDPLLRSAAGGDDSLDMSVASFSAPKPQFLDLPEVLVNLNTTSATKNFLKIKITLELADGNDLSKVEALMPRIVDTFQVYLRELRAGDLSGAQGIYRLRKELYGRVVAHVKPVVIKDILFKEIVVQ